MLYFLTINTSTGRKSPTDTSLFETRPRPRPGTTTPLVGLPVRDRDPPRFPETEAIE